MQQAGNEGGQTYLADIIAVHRSVSTVLATVVVGGFGSPTAVDLSDLGYTVDAGATEILILPQSNSPTGSGFFAVDDITILGTFHP